MSVELVASSSPSYSLSNDSEVFYSAHQAKELAGLLGFSDYEQSMVCSAVSEIAMNALRHGKGGDASATINKTKNEKGIEVTIQDSGTGIDNLELAFVDGFTTYGSMGVGLGAAQRSVDEVIVNKSDKTGTSITLRHYLPLPEDEYDIGSISFSAVGEHSNGDAYLIKEYEGEKILIAVLDGAGHGPKAEVASTIAKNVIKASYKLPLDQIIIKCDQAIKKALCVRAVEMCLLRITPDELEFVGIGNVNVFACSLSGISFPIQNGSAGMSIPPKIHVVQSKRPEKFCFVLYTDGIKSKGIREIYMPEKSAYKNAQSIFDNNSLSHDDATIVVIKG